MFALLLLITGGPAIGWPLHSDSWGLASSEFVSKHVRSVPTGFTPTRSKLASNANVPLSGSVSSIVSVAPKVVPSLVVLALDHRLKKEERRGVMSRDVRTSAASAGTGGGGANGNLSSTLNALDQLMGEERRGVASRNSPAVVGANKIDALEETLGDLDKLLGIVPETADSAPSSVSNDPFADPRWDSLSGKRAGSIDELLTGPVPMLINELASPDVDLNITSSSAAKCLDAVCAYAGTSSMQNDIGLQDELQRTYRALARRGVLRGFGSCRDQILPLPQNFRGNDLQRLTGLPAESFSPPDGNGFPELVAGSAAFWIMVYVSEQLGLDFRLVGGGFAAALVADRLVLRGSIVETIGGIVRPSYRRTVLQHEAGHLLIAYLLGDPIQACLLDALSSLKDDRFDDVTAGTVFYDPEFAKSVPTGKFTPKCLDRYTMVVMAGIAAEAMVNQKVEGGQADESALIQLLSTINNGQTWNFERIQSQARGAAAQAYLLLRKHESAYAALCVALEKGATIGEAIMAIEDALRKRELATSKPQLLAAIEAMDSRTWNSFDWSAGIAAAFGHFKLGWRGTHIDDCILGLVVLLFMLAVTSFRKLRTPRDGLRGALIRTQ